MTNILIADDHNITRRGLEMMLEDCLRSCRITHASNGDEVFTAMKNNIYDLVILDLNMPDTDAAGLLSQIQAIREGQKVLIFSMNPEKIFAFRYLQMGASGYIQKSANDDTIERAVKTVLKGGKYFSDELLSELSDPTLAATHATPFDKLTDREFEIARHLIRGLSVGQIARIVKVHTSTIGTQRAQILKKTGVTNVMELNQLARLHHIATD